MTISKFPESAYTDKGSTCPTSTGRFAAMLYVMLFLPVCIISALHGAKLPFPALPVTVLSGFVVLFTAVLHIISGNRAMRRIAGPAIPAVALATAPFMLHYTGGFFSPFLLLYLCAVAASAYPAQCGQRTIYVYGAWLLLCYLAVASLHRSEAIIDPALFARELNDSPGLFFCVTICFSCAIAATALIAATCARKLSQASDKDRQTALCIKELRSAQAEARIVGKQPIRDKMEPLGRLSRTIAHDYNNLNTAIGGYLSLLQKKLATGAPELQSYTEKIMKTVIKASDLCNRFSSFAGIKQPLREPVSIHSAIHQAIGTLTTSKVGSMIKFETDLQADSDTVSGDPELLNETLMHLLANACESYSGTTADAGTVTVRTSVVELNATDELCAVFAIPAGAVIRMEIADQGCGMSQDAYKNVFEPFFTTKSGVKGAGVGLTMVWRYIIAFNDAIEIMPGEKGGTSVFIYFPLIKQIPDALPEEKSLLPAQGEPSCDSNATRVRIVDDEESIRDIFREVLSGHGYRVFVCCDGVEAIEFLDKGLSHVDLVLLDIFMPGMNGPETFRMIRRRLPGMPVLLMSGNVQEEMISAIMAEPATAFMIKPCSNDQLIEYVRMMTHYINPRN